jgi:hypothetical protein
MLSQSPGIYIICAALISGFLTLASSLLTTLISNRYQLEREKQQGLRQQESDRQKWYREKIYDSYQTSIQVLTKIIQQHNTNKKKAMMGVDHWIELENLYFEFQSVFQIIIAGYPEKDSEDFKEELNKINESLQEMPLLARYIVTSMMERDSRIKGLDK